MSAAKMTRMYFIQLPFMHAGNYPQRRMGAGLFYGDREQPFGGGNPTDPSNLSLHTQSQVKRKQSYARPDSTGSESNIAHKQIGAAIPISCGAIHSCNRALSFMTDAGGWILA